jgi:hypothetical protein
MLKPAQSPKTAQSVALTPLQADLAALLAEMLVLELQGERLEREGKPTVCHVTN